MSKKKFKTILCGCINGLLSSFDILRFTADITMDQAIRILTAEIKRQQKRHSHQQGR